MSGTSQDQGYGKSGLRGGTRSLGHQPPEECGSTSGGLRGEGPDSFIRTEPGSHLRQENKWKTQGSLLIDDYKVQGLG